MVEESLVTGIAIDHCVAIDSPRLPAAPHGGITVALMRHALDEVAVYCIINCYVITTTILTELVLHRGLGMTHGNIIEVFSPLALKVPLSHGRGVGGEACPEQQFQIHHIVHDGVVTAIVFHVAWPAEDGSHLIII